MTVLSSQKTHDILQATRRPATATAAAAANSASLTISPPLLPSPLPPSNKMSALDLPSTHAPSRKRLRPFLRCAKRARLSSRHLRALTLFFVFALLLVACRQFQLLSHSTLPDRVPPNGPLFSLLTSISSMLFATDVETSEPSVNLWRRTEVNYPQEKDPPDPKLYGTQGERCFALGAPHVAVSPTDGTAAVASMKPPPGHPAAFWQMNSRSMCYVPQGACLYGRQLQNLLTFEPRGTGACELVSVKDGLQHDARHNGLNESCAAFRRRSMADMFGHEVFMRRDDWYSRATKGFSTRGGRQAVGWESEFAILIPKYAWSYNICHYNRIWNFVIYVIRNLDKFVDDVASIKRIDVLFRAGYRYDQHWHTGIREATIPALQREVGKPIRVAKLRFNYRLDFQCIRRGILLGQEGRVDAFPFFNDTPVWRPAQQVDDSHWPSVPHDSLWLRQVVYNWSGLPAVGSFRGPGIGTFERIPAPPRKIGVLLRSPRSRRRLTNSGKLWLDETLQKLANKYGMSVVYIRTSAAMSFKEQVAEVRDVGVAVGLHGANMVNSIFMPPGGAFFEIFPWRYVRYYYASGGNSGLRYSFHEPVGGVDRRCQFESPSCFMKYRESLIYLTEKDRARIWRRLEKAIGYVADLHRRYGKSGIPLRQVGNEYHFDR